MIALALALLLVELPSPPLPFSREQVESRFGPPSMAGPPGLSWPPGSVLASYVETPDDVDGICRRHVATARGIRWVGLVYYAPDGRLVAAHCLRLDDLDNGHDVTPDVVARLRGGGA